MSTDNKLYIGSVLVITDPKSFNPCEVVEYGTASSKVTTKTVSFTPPHDVRNVNTIYDNILKPFSDSKIFDTFQKPSNLFLFINEFVSFDKLFMYVLKQKYDKDYSIFMDLCKSNMEKINWNAQDDEGNTMLHYVTIMNKYPEIACEIIQHMKGRGTYTNLFNTTNSEGVVPLASVQCDKFICDHTREVNSNIIKSLIDAGANLLLRSKDSDTYDWKGRDQIFCVSNREPNTLLVAPKGIMKTSYVNYRICCILKEPPECQLYVTTDLNRDLPDNLLERVLKFPCIEIHKSLLTNNNCNITKTMPGGTPCIHYIVEYGSRELVEVMFDRGLDSSYSGTNVNKNTDFSLLDKHRNSILHTAILKRKADNAVVIMNRCSGKTLNVMLDTQNNSKETPLDLAIVEKLFSLIASFNLHRPEIFRAIDRAGNTWFHRSVLNKSEELLRVLTEQKNLTDYVNSENSNQYTPLMLCVREQFVEGFTILKETKKCRIDVRDREGYSLLHLAIIYYEKEIFSELLQVIVSDNRLLIERRVEIPKSLSTTSPKYPRLTPLILSMKCNQFVATRLLIQNGADIHKPDCEGRTFNSHLIETCHDYSQLSLFFTNTVVTDCIYNDVSSLSLSVQYTNKTVFNLLLPKCDLGMIAYQDDTHNSVLNLILSQAKYTCFLKQFLSRLDGFYQDETRRAKLCQIIDKQNKKGETPLISSIVSRDSKLVGKLLDLGCSVTEDILHLATKHGNLQMITCILDRIPDDQLINKMLSSYIQDQTPLHIAISRKKVDILKKYLSLDIDLTKQESEVATLLNHAIEHGEETFQTVFEHFRKMEGQFLENCLETRFPTTTHSVIQSINHINLLALKTLIEYNKSYKNIIVGNLSLLHYAITKQFIEGVKHLISVGLLLATHDSERTITLHSDTLKLRLVFTKSKVGYKLGSGYVLTDIPNFERTEYSSNITTVRYTTELFQNLVQCKSLEPLQQYLSIHKPLQPSFITLLSMASSKYATLQIMEYLLSSSDGQKCIIDVDSTDSNGNTVVHNGIYIPCIQSFTLLLDHIDRINTPVWSGNYTPVIFSTTNHIDRLNKQNYSPLELSMIEYKKQAFLLLRQHGASYTTNGSGQNILHRYITCKITDIWYLDLILEDLSQQKSELINEYNSIGNTPLHTAVSTGNIPVYSKLIAVPSCNYDIDTKSGGNNIVHLAVQKGNPELLKLILVDLKILEKDKNEENQLINRENTKKLTPQFLAVEEGDIDLILDIPEFSCVSADVSNLLHHAVKCSDKSLKHLRMIEIVNASDMSNETPLHYAVTLSRESALIKLLECPSIDFSCQNHRGLTALHLAITRSTNVLTILLNAIDKLSESNRIIDIQDKEDKTALHHCIELSNKERLRLLLARSPDVTLVDSKSNNILHYAANTKVEVLKALTAHIKGKSPDITNDLLSQQNKENNTPLCCAIQMKNIPCVKEFLTINAPLPVSQEDGTTTLCNRQPFPHTKVPMCLYEVKLTDKPDLRICVGFELSDKRWIISDLPKLTYTYLTPQNFHPTQYQCVSKIPNISESILKSSLLACHCYEPLELVIDTIKDQKYTNDAKLMHLAATYGTIQVVEYLMELYGANVPFSDLDNKGYSVIHYSIENTEEQILRILCNIMKKYHPRDLTELSGKLLQFCITEDHLNAFKILLEYLADTTYTDTNGDTLLHLIVLRSRRVEYVRELLNSPQLVASEYCNIVNRNSNTALHLAINTSQIFPVSEILKYNPDVSIHDSHHNTALHLAIQNSTTGIIEEIVGYIKRLPSKLELINKANDTQSKNRPIHLATQRGSREIVELLLSNGAELYSLDAYDNTILHSAVKCVENCLEMKTNILQYEKRSGVEVDKFIHLQNMDGRTPLHLAIEDGCIACIELLLKQPINLSLVDTSGETILHYAIRRGNDVIFDLVYEFIF